MFKILEAIPKIIAWLQIFISPFITGLAIAGIIYLTKVDDVGFLLAVLVASLGFVIGVFWAESVRKKRGTVEFMSRVHATRELDNIERKEKE